VKWLAGRPPLPSPPLGLEGLEGRPPVERVTTEATFNSSVLRAAAFLSSCARLLSAGGVYIYKTEELAPSLPTSFSRPHAQSPLFPHSNGDHIDPLSQYGLEETFIWALQNSPYVTDDPTTARLFVIPQYATLETHSCLYAESPIPANRLQDCAANVSRTYLLPLIDSIKKTPSYRRYGGRDHFWVFPWDDSWKLFPGVPEALATNHFFGYVGPPENVVILPVTARFSAALEDVERNYLLGGSSRAYAAEKLKHPGTFGECKEVPPHKYLASFAGTVWGTRVYSKGLRQDLLEKFPLAKADTTKIAFIDKHLPVEEYRTLLRDSLFCLSPQGWTPWSQRLFFAIATGCIPVFFDLPGFNIQLPYPDLNWPAFSLVIPEGEHLNVDTILSSISAAEVCRMRSELAVVAPYLIWSATPQVVLQGALHEAYKRIEVAELTEKA
jgi:hypothetical protein